MLRPRSRRFTGVMALLLLLGCVRPVHAAEELRTWSDESGRHQLTASYVSHDDRTVTLKDQTGRLFQIERNKLSRADRTYVEQRETDNPFKEKAESPFKAKAESPFKSVPDANAPPADADAPNGEPDSDRPSRPPARLRHGKYLPVTPPDGGWEYVPQGRAELGFDPQPVAHPDVEIQDFIKQFEVARTGTHGVVTFFRPRESTRISLLDLRSGELVLSSVAPGEYVALAIEDGGERIALRSDKFGFGEQREIGIFLVQESELVEESRFVPFSDLRPPEMDVAWAAFVGAHYLLAASESGRMSLWDLTTLREVCYFDLGGLAVVACGPDPDVIAFTDHEQFGLFDVARQKFLGIAPLPAKINSLKLAFSPSGGRLAIAGDGRILIADTATGEITDDLSLAGLTLSRVEFPADDFLLGSGRDLITLTDQFVLWSYTGIAESRSVGGTTFAVSGSSRTHGSVTPARLPDAKARAAWNDALTRPDQFILRPGGSVRLDVSQVPANYQRQVQDALTKQLSERKITVDDRSETTVAAGIAGPENKVVEYGRSLLGGGATGYVVSEYVSKLEVIWNGAVAWSTQRTNAPGRVTAKKGQTLQDALREATSQPNLRIFEATGLPSYVRRPSGKTPQSGQALGRTDVDELSP